MPFREDVHGVRRLEADHAAPGEAVHLPHVAPGRAVALVAAALPVGAEGDARGHAAVAERSAEGAADLGAVQVAVAEVDVGVELVAGPAADEVDCPGRGVAAVERALGTLQDLHAVEVEELEREHGGGDQVHLVRVDADRGVVVDRVVVQADAADADVRNAVAEHDVGVQVGRLRREVRGLAEAEFLEVRAGERGHRDAHVAERLRALERGDDDLVDDRSVRGVGLLRGDGSRDERTPGNEAGERPSKRAQSEHLSLLHPTDEP